LRLWTFGQLGGLSHWLIVVVVIVIVHGLVLLDLVILLERAIRLFIFPFRRCGRLQFSLERWTPHPSPAAITASHVDLDIFLAFCIVRLGSQILV
jgi:hypothetical protein